MVHASQGPDVHVQMATFCGFCAHADTLSVVSPSSTAEVDPVCPISWHAGTLRCIYHAHNEADTPYGDTAYASGLFRSYKFFTHILRLSRTHAKQ